MLAFSEDGDEVEDAEHQDDARTEDHQNSCGQVAVGSLHDRRSERLVVMHSKAWPPGRVRHVEPDTLVRKVGFKRIHF